jgi:hypothetical protein
LTESVTTYPIAAAAVKKLAAVPKCTDSTAPHDVMLGYDVVQAVEELPNGPNRIHIRRIYWKAPALNCLALKVISTRLSNGAEISSNVYEVTSVRLVPPDSAWFDVPGSYTERSPGEVMAEYNRRYSVFGRTLPAPPVLDDAYAHTRSARN